MKYHFQVWFQNRRAKRRKHSKCSPNDNSPTLGVFPFVAQRQFNQINFPALMNPQQEYPFQHQLSVKLPYLGVPRIPSEIPHLQNIFQASLVEPLTVNTSLTAVDTASSGIAPLFLANQRSGNLINQLLLSPAEVPAIFLNETEF